MSGYPSSFSFLDSLAPSNYSTHSKAQRTQHITAQQHPWKMDLAAGEEAIGMGDFLALVRSRGG
jgi:hypothetical protein